MRVIFYAATAVMLLSIIAVDAYMLPGLIGMICSGAIAIAAYKYLVRHDSKWSKFKD